MGKGRTRRIQLGGGDQEGNGGDGVNLGEQVAGGEEGFGEVAGDYFFWIADGGQVDAGVPVEEYIDVRRYTSELGRGQNSRFLTGPSDRFGMTRVWDGG